MKSQDENRQYTGGGKQRGSNQFSPPKLVLNGVSPALDFQRPASSGSGFLQKFTKIAPDFGYFPLPKKKKKTKDQWF
jgi:hypothetical protein